MNSFELRQHFPAVAGRPNDTAGPSDAPCIARVAVAIPEAKMRESNQASCRRLLLLLIAVGTPAACEKLSAPDSATGGARVAPASAATFNTTRLTEPDTGPWARIVEGEVGPGSLYALYIPRDWNGDAIYFVHGVRNPTLPVT